MLGAGKIRGILLRAFLDQKLVQPKRVHPGTSRREGALSRQAIGNRGVHRQSRGGARDIIILAVKRQAVKEVLEEIKPEMKPGKLIVSVVASVPDAAYGKAPGHGFAGGTRHAQHALRDWCGMTGLAKGIHAGKEHLEIAQAMFEAVGRVVVVDEKQIDAVTGLSASGTAFIYIFLESLAEGGVKVGLPRDVSTLLAAQTMMGAARMVSIPAIIPRF